MAEVDNRLILELGYENTTKTRQYSYGGISTSELPNIESRIMTYNANVPAEDKLVFVSDDGDSMTSIFGAKVEQTTTTYVIQR